jgi:hypothetical protein
MPSPSSEIHADQIRDMHIRKRSFQQQGIDAVLERCYTKIKLAIRSRSTSSSCVFEIPEFLFGYPMYDLTECVLYVKRHLETNGFKVSYFFPRLLVVSWAAVISSITSTTPMLMSPSAASSPSTVLLGGPSTRATMDRKKSGKAVLNILR